ncbi:unnamed protein product [Linum trigynum]|uniref:C2H2-type domain-containing protein n=1 Tax=Linum trigynum TaxID=586398 RepID=A0AAV2CYN7_9ROSI
MCLVMLSRDVNWKGRFSYKSDEIEEEDEEEEAENGGEIKRRAEIEEEDQGIMERGSRIRGKKLKCEKCTKQFRSSQALGSHRRICSTEPIARVRGGEGEQVNGLVQGFGSGQGLIGFGWTFKIWRG